MHARPCYKNKHAQYMKTTACVAESLRPCLSALRPWLTLDVIINTTSPLLMLQVAANMQQYQRSPIVKILAA